MAQAALFGDAFIPVVAAQTTPHQLIVDTWDRLWRESRGVKWAWCAKDTAFVKRTLRERASGDAALVIARMKKLLLDPPRAWYATEASPAILFSHWNALAVKLSVQGKVEPLRQPAKRECVSCRADLTSGSRYSTSAGEVCVACHMKSW